jgi:heme/copper-type cytochrome/quinol oxidase subunit 4
MNLWVRRVRRNYFLKEHWLFAMQMYYQYYIISVDTQKTSMWAIYIYYSVSSTSFDYAYSSTGGNYIHLRIVTTSELQSHIKTYQYKISITLFSLLTKNESRLIKSPVSVCVCVCLCVCVCVCVFMFCHQTEGQNNYVQVANKCFENAAKSR